MKLNRKRTRVHIANDNGIAQPTFYTTKEAAHLLRVSPVTLARWRISGCGPCFRKFGRKVVYRKRDLLVWAKQQTRTSTSAA